MRVFIIRFWYFLLGEMYLIIHGKPCTDSEYRVSGGYARNERGWKLRDYYQAKWARPRFPWPDEPFPDF